MASASLAEVLAVGVATPLGLDGPSTAAAVRAGLSRFQDSSYQNRRQEPQVVSLVPAEHLGSLHPSIAADAGSRSARMLQLGAYALAQATVPCLEPPALLLALPEERAGVAEPVGGTFVRDLARQADVVVAERSSRLYRQGGAGALFALRDALALLSAGAPEVVVGGVDSFWDSQLLDVLDGEARLVGSSMDGFVPGEGAGFLLLGSVGAHRRLRLRPLATVVGVGVDEEPGHRHADAPCRGDGLSGAVRQALAHAPRDPVRTVYAGLNGESLPAKEWSIAYLRNASGFAEDHALEHPADCIGDAGAGLAPILLALAALGISHGQCDGPCLVWAASDRAARGAAVLIAT